MEEQLTLAGLLGRHKKIYTVLVNCNDTICVWFRFRKDKWTTHYPAGMSCQMQSIQIVY